MLRVETEEPTAEPGLPGRWGGKGRTGHGLGVHLPSATCMGTAGCSQALRATLFPGELINGLHLAGLDGNCALKQGWGLLCALTFTRPGCR